MSIWLTLVSHSRPQMTLPISTPTLWLVRRFWERQGQRQLVYRGGQSTGDDRKAGEQSWVSYISTPAHEFKIISGWESQSGQFG